MKRIDHISIAVTNVPRAVKWYTKQFDCEVIYKDSSWARLKFENIDLTLVLPSEHPPHIAFIDDKLKESDPVVRKHRDGSIGKYDHDGFGNLVEYIKYKK